MVKGRSVKKKCEKRAGARERQGHFSRRTTNAPFPKLHMSFFRFTPFNTSPLFYLRAWAQARGGSAPRSNPLPFYIPFLTTKIPLWPSLELCITFSCCKCTVYKLRIKHDTRMFSRISHSHKLHLLALLGLFTDKNGRFSYRFI